MELFKNTTKDNHGQACNHKKIILISNTAWYLYNFRLTLMQTLQSKGYDVVAIAPYDAYVEKIKQHKISYISITMNNKGKNPIEDVFLICRLYALFKIEKPNIILTYTPKPNIYSSIAARFLNIPVINNIAGLGALFIKNNIITEFAKYLYKFALQKSDKVFFQNNDDMALFLKKKLVNVSIAERIPGSGVDTKKFAPLDGNSSKEGFVFLLVGRMLWDKGVGELVQAMRSIKPHYPKVDCQLLGFMDVQSPSAISQEQVQQWKEEGVITYLGETDNVIKYMRAADCIVLPSYYREGIPRALLEAASLAKPIITTDSVGCKEVVDDKVTGYLCRARDSEDLAAKMINMINLSEDERVQMGQRGREKMIKEFEERIVIQRYLDVIESLV